MVEESTRNMQAGTASAQSTAEQLEEIVQVSTKVADFLGEIALASKEQAQGVEQISSGLEQIDQVTQANTASAEESAAASEELAAQGKQLRALVARFRLADTGNGGSRDAGRRALVEYALEERLWGEATQQDTEAGGNGRETQGGVPATVAVAEDEDRGHQSANPAEVIDLDDRDFGKF